MDSSRFASAFYPVFPLVQLFTIGCNPGFASANKQRLGLLVRVCNIIISWVNQIYKLICLIVFFLGIGLVASS